MKPIDPVLKGFEGRSRSRGVYWETVKVRFEWSTGYLDAASTASKANQIGPSLDYVNDMVTL